MTLTREEILAMEPGRELDAAVSNEVLLIEAQYRHWFAGAERHYDWMNSNLDIIPQYSSDISAAWEVVEKFNMVQIEYVEWFVGNKSTYVKIDVQTSEMEFKESEVTGKTAPEAICKCALLAVLNL